MQADRPKSVVVISGFRHARKKQHGVGQVESERDRNSPMSTAHTAEFTRELAAHLVNRAELRTGKKMEAYEAVARSIGTSSSWLRKFIAGREAKEPGWAIGWSIVNQYRRMCSRVEAEIETERAKYLALKEIIDAASGTVDQVVESTSGKPAA